jgi:hypothetical protein
LLFPIGIEVVFFLQAVSELGRGITRPEIEIIETVVEALPNPVQ